MRTTAISSFLTALLVVGCRGISGGDDSTTWEAVVDTVGDTITVRTVAGSVWGDTAELIPEMRIGVLDGPDEYMLGSVRSLAVSPAGDIYLVDGQVPVVRKYSPDGTHLYDLGAEGGGPGEYKSPDGGLGVLSDGRVLVRDPGNNRINVYGPSGESLTSWRLPGGFSTGQKLYVDAEDRALTTVLLEGYRAITMWRYGLVPYGPDGVSGDTMPVPRWEYDPPTITGGGARGRFEYVPFSPTQDFSYSKLGYFVAGLSTAYAIHLFPPGRPILRIEKVWTPVRVNAEEADERYMRLRNSFRRQFPGWRWNGPGLPDQKPPFKRVYAGDDGRIWVLVSQEARPVMSAADARAVEEETGQLPLRYEEPPAFDVFEPDGTFLGHVRAPDGMEARYPPPIFRGEHVWAVMRGELDVTTVVRLKAVVPSGS